MEVNNQNRYNTVVLYDNFLMVQILLISKYFQLIKLKYFQDFVSCGILGRQGE